MNIDDKLRQYEPLLAASPPEYYVIDEHRNRNINKHCCQIKCSKSCKYGCFGLYIIISIIYVIWTFYYIKHSKDYNPDHTTSTHPNIM